MRFEYRIQYPFSVMEHYGCMMRSEPQSELKSNICMQCNSNNRMFPQICSFVKMKHEQRRLPGWCKRARHFRITEHVVSRINQEACRSHTFNFRVHSVNQYKTERSLLEQRHFLQSLLCQSDNVTRWIFLDGLKVLVSTCQVCADVF